MNFPYICCMESSFSLHYVYLHKTTEGLPFYIGIGTKQFGDHQSTCKKYGRAYSKTGRTQFWHRIVKKHGITIEILVESNDYEYIKAQEIFFISKFGRRDKKKGTLCNLTDGGDGTIGTVFSEDRIKKMSEIGKMIYLAGKSPFSKEGFYEESSLRMKGNQYAKGVKLTQDRRDKLDKARVEKLSKRVVQENRQGVFIKEWHTTVEAADSLGVSYKTIWKACKFYYKGATSQGFRWRFKD